MVTAQAIGNMWKIEGPVAVEWLEGPVAVAWLNDNEFGTFLAHMQRTSQDVLIHRFDTACDQCEAAPNENHVFGCQYLLD